MKKPNPVSDFLTSAASLDQCPLHDYIEIAVVGRSNVGKSSLLNKILKRELVKVSQTPGKTQLINFFSKEGKYCLVDLPGYGYAKLSKETVQEWQVMIESYLMNRKQLLGVLFLLDIRREFEEEERQLLRWLKQLDMPLAFVFTKADKLSQSELRKAERDFSKKFAPSFFVSCLKNTGIMELEDFIYKKWVKGIK